MVIKSFKLKQHEIIIYCASEMLFRSDILYLFFIASSGLCCHIVDLYTIITDILWSGYTSRDWSALGYIFFLFNIIFQTIF